LEPNVHVSLATLVMSFSDSRELVSNIIWSE
jgi:hypothetical protein